MSLWDGNLRNSPGDVAIDSILLLLIALAYSVQISRLLNTGSTNGISPYFLLFNAIFSNLQLANTLLLAARAWPTEKTPVLELTGDGALRGSQALGAVLGLAQVALQWAGSIAILTLFSAYTITSSKSISAIAFVHAALFLFPAVVIALPKPSPLAFGIDIFTGFSGIVNTWISLLFVALQFYPQVLEFRRMSGSPGSLSLLSLGLRAVVMIAVAVRWFMRFGPPAWRDEQADQSAPPYLWYQWGWLPFNYIIEGVGCAALVVMYLQAGRVSGTSDEETPLLA